MEIPEVYKDSARKHILLNTVFRYKRREKIIPPSAFYYDRAKGAWLSENDHSLLIHDKSFPAIASKKKDIETGEDEKSH